MNRDSFWPFWLLVIAFTMAAFGVLMVLSSGTPLFAGLVGEIELAFMPAGSASFGWLRFRDWVFGVWGATVAGFGLLAALIGGRAFARRERWARDALAGALALWYVLDTGVSLVYGVWINVAFNTVVLVAFVLPLAFTWTRFGAGDRTTQRPGL